MKTYTYSYQNGPCRGREAGRGRLRTASAEAGKLGRVPAPSSVRVGAYRIRPPNISQGMNDHTRGRAFAPCRGAWRTYAFAPLPYRQEALLVPGQIRRRPSAPGTYPAKLGWRP